MTHAPRQPLLLLTMAIAAASVISEASPDAGGRNDAWDTGSLTGFRKEAQDRDGIVFDKRNFAYCNRYVCGRLGGLGVIFEGIRGGGETRYRFCDQRVGLSVAWERLLCWYPPCVTSHIQTPDPFVPSPITTDQASALFIVRYCLLLPNTLPSSKHTAPTTSPSPPLIPHTPTSIRASSFCKSKPSHDTAPASPISNIWTVGTVTGLNGIVT